MNPVYCLLSIAILLSAGTERAAAIDLPDFSAVFTVACAPHPATLPRYFDDASLLTLYPHLKPSKVFIAVGAKRVWQSGVIVTKGQEVFVLENMFQVIHCD